jgi:hypothetical protein
MILIGGQRFFTKWAGLIPSIDPGIWMSVNITAVYGVRRLQLSLSPMPEKRFRG